MQSKNLTIMFTDIKGFTARVSDGTRDDVVKLRTLNDRLIRPVIEHYAGNVIKTIGDAFLATFDSPTDGVLCGVTILEVLRKHNKDATEDARLEVRVAINSGDVEISDSDVHGEAVNIAARLESVAEAGEVYFTEAVYLTMNRNEAPSAAVGEHIFKGVPYPVRVYKVIQDPDAPLGRRLSEEVTVTEDGPVLGLGKSTSSELVRRRIHWKWSVAAGIVCAALVVTHFIPGKAERALRSAEQALDDGDAMRVIELAQIAANKGYSSPELKQTAGKAARALTSQKLAKQGPAATYQWLEQAVLQNSVLAPLRDDLAVLDAKATAQKIAGGLIRTEQAIEDLLDRHPNNPGVPSAAAKALERVDWYASSYLHRTALSLGAPVDDSGAFTYCKRGFRKFGPGNARNCHDLAEKFFATQRVDWARSTIRATTSGQEFLNAWHILRKTDDPLFADAQLKLLHDLLDGYNDEDEADDALKRLKKITDVSQRERVLGLHVWVLDPQDVPGWGWSRKDLIERNHRDLSVAWR